MVGGLGDEKIVAAVFALELVALGGLVGGMAGKEEEIAGLDDEGEAHEKEGVDAEGGGHGAADHLGGLGHVLQGGQG